MPTIMGERGVGVLLPVVAAAARVDYLARFPGHQQLRMYVDYVGAYIISAVDLV